jgi:hypothetical protein
MWTRGSSQRGHGAADKIKATGEARHLRRRCADARSDHGRSRRVDRKSVIAAPCDPCGQHSSAVSRDYVTLFQVDEHVICADRRRAMILEGERPFRTNQGWSWHDNATGTRT